MQKTIALYLLLTDTQDEPYTTDMAVERDLSGLTICAVLEQRLTLATVVTMAGVHTTAVIVRTFPLHAITVSKFFLRCTRLPYYAYYYFTACSIIIYKILNCIFVIMFHLPLRLYLLLSINYTKCYFAVDVGCSEMFYIQNLYSQTRICTHRQTYNINDTILPTFESVRDLGVIVDHHLKVDAYFYIAGCS